MRPRCRQSRNPPVKFLLFTRRMFWSWALAPPGWPPLWPPRAPGPRCRWSTGSAAWAAVEVAKKYGPDKRIVTMMCDSVRNYMTKFLDDAWMRENGFTESLWETNSLGELLRSLPPRELITANSADTVGATIETLKSRGISQVVPPSSASQETVVELGTSTRAEAPSMPR